MGSNTTESFVFAVTFVVWSISNRKKLAISISLSPIASIDQKFGGPIETENSHHFFSANKEKTVGKFLS